jgi:nucleobase:cation symporter-1, NCS1 family
MFILSIESDVLATVVMSDFWIVRKGMGYNVYHLYKPGGIYWYSAGINPRAMIAFVVGMTPLIPGLAYNINPSVKVSQGILNFYTLAWLDGLVFAA